MSAARFRESWRDLYYAVNRTPEDGWRAQAAHHGSRGLLVVVLAVGLAFLFTRSGDETSGFEPNTVAPADVIADQAVELPKPAAELAAERQQAAGQVPPVLALDPTAADSSSARSGRFLDDLGRAFEADGGVAGEEVQGVLAAYNVSLGAQQLDYLQTAAARSDMDRALARAYAALLPDGVVSTRTANAFTHGTVTVDGVAVPVESLTTVEEFADNAYSYAPAPMQAFSAFRVLLTAFATPSLRVAQDLWVAAQDSARSAVDTVFGTVLEGERIITQHERVSAEDIRRLEAYYRATGAEAESLVARTGRFIGHAMFAALVLALVGVCLLLYRPGLYSEYRHFAIVVVLMAATVAGAAAVSSLGLPSELIPVVALALALGAVYEGMLSLVAVLAVSLLLAALPEVAPLYDVETLALGGSVAALGVRRIRRRRQSWALIAGITTAFVAAALALFLLGGYSLGAVLETLVWGFVGATLYTVLTLGGLVPLLEKVTGISTAQTLLELSDLNAPLLREMSLKAPGTYAHSINIANLAEAACEAIGADSLLARAGAYYHDIGKMVNPQYFVENQPKGRNPHDRLPPMRSAAIIRDHVRDGVRLASENSLPPRMHDFIREHHGTGLIRYFYDRAVEEAGEDSYQVNPADYAYLGPKPQTRESAVIMLADGIESATRVLGDPTPERIRATIDAIADARLAEGQLDQCPLTLREIDRCKSAFARVLIGMYHRRIDYPSGIRSRDDAQEASPADDTEPSRASPRRRQGRAGSEDQLEAALEPAEASDVVDAEASVRAADE